MGYSRSADGSRIFANHSLLLGQMAFTRTDNGTEQLNIDGVAQGSPVTLWNGTGGGDSGGDWTVTGQGSETVQSMHSGTQGWDTGVVAQNDTTVFDNGSELDIAGTYDELTFWLQPKAWPTSSRLRLKWLDSSGVAVSSNIRVENYATNMDLDVWQQVSIPIADFSLTGDAQKLEVTYRVMAGQQHWFDDIELIASAGGGPYRFRVAAPDANTLYHVSMISLVVSGPQAGWTATSFGNIGSGLSKGLLLRQRRMSDSEVLWSFNSRDNTDLFGRYHPQDDIAFSDGTLLMGFMVKPGIATIVITDDDVLEFVVRDDLTGLTNMRAFVHFGTESAST